MIDPFSKEMKAIVAALMRDNSKVFVQLRISDLEVLMSILLDYACEADTPETVTVDLIQLAKYLSNIIEEQRPESEPYLAFMFGAVVFRRAGLN